MKKDEAEDLCYQLSKPMKLYIVQTEWYWFQDRQMDFLMEQKRAQKQTHTYTTTYFSKSNAEGSKENHFNNWTINDNPYHRLKKTQFLVGWNVKGKLKKTYGGKHRGLFS